MRTLYLLRHAEAAPRAPGEADHDRGLTAVGRRAAAGIGEWLATRARLPGLVLCSSARRAVETLAAVRDFLPGPLEVHCERGLYLAAGEAILERLDVVDSAEAAVLVVGHNPGLGQLGAELARTATGNGAARLQQGLPTAALVELVFDAPRWCDVAATGAQRAELTLPPNAASTR